MDFGARDSRSKYCCVRCAQQGYLIRRRNRAEFAREKVCPVCDVDFKRTRRDAVYCNRACKQRAYRVRVARIRLIDSWASEDR